MVKHLILGTAGHIDHGKTALVKALTGIDCDTHKEEKRRGITINLGFAHLSLDTGDTVGIVDVPGHRDFVHTMVAGASGIDCVLLVVAADSGVMPQTREHLAICRVLGIRSGIIAVTKTDLANDAVLIRRHDELAAFTKGTFLEGCPVVDVSCVTGQGIPTLLAVIAETLSQVPGRTTGRVFRMYIDRIFSVSGFGTVVTGSVKSGTLRVGDTAYLLPPQKELRVRRIERYGTEVSEVTAGDRASLNLVGLSKEEFERGMLVSDRPLTSTMLLDVKLRLFENVRPLNRWSQAAFIMGTFEAQAKIHLLETDSARGGETVLAQIHLPAACCAAAQDTFVLRNSSSDITIGGGEIVDPHPLHHRRRPLSLIAELKELAGGKLPRLVAIETAKHARGIDHLTIAEALNISPDDVIAILKSELPESVSLFPFNGKQYLIAKQHEETLAAAALKSITDFHKANPLKEAGRTTEELQGILGMGTGDDAKQMTEAFLEHCVKRGMIKRVGHTFSLCTHAVNISKQETEQVRALEEFFKKSNMQTPVYADCVMYARKHSIDEKRLKQLMNYMVSARILYLVEGQYLHASVVDKCRKMLLDALVKEPDGLTVARFRDLVFGNRKICLLLYALFDAEGITQRQEDVRVITEKGNKIQQGAAFSASNNIEVEPRR
jgi:selenocysteine-specific elongation factor